jgi:branched-chain amino acid transport system ATP-binding protein
MLRVEGIHAYYGKSHVLQGVSLEVREGQIVGLLGRNGVGKTTTLRSIMKLTPPRQGRVVLGSTILSDLPAYRIPRQGVGYVPQGRQIFPALTVQENLELGILKHGAPSALDEVSRLFPWLADRQHQLGGTLSGGEAQMLAIARCLVTRPRVLLLDEPTEGLMPMMVAQIRTQIRAINESGVSILLVEQNLKTALDLCERIYLMEKGVITYEATAPELRNDKATLRRYLGVSA